MKKSIVCRVNNFLFFLDLMMEVAMEQDIASFRISIIDQVAGKAWLVTWKPLVI